MDSPDTLNWPTSKTKLSPKQLLISTKTKKKNSFSNKKKVYARLKEPITWHTHLVHPKKFSYFFKTKYYFNTIFKTKTFLYVLEKISFLPEEKISCI